jgi:hypothetical protein
MTEIFNSRGIVIVKNSISSYQLSFLKYELFWNKNEIIDKHGSTTMSFKPQEEMFWDMKLLLHKKLSIGKCRIGIEIFSVYIQGIINQKIFYRDEHIISRNKMVLSLEENFDNKDMAHLSLLLVLAAYNERKE